MTTPENLVKHFIRDYFQWNNKFSGLMSKIKDSQDSDLSSIGINELILNANQIKNVSQYVEIKGQHAEENVELMANADAEYKKLIEKYCCSEFQPLGASFGGNPDHHPDNEKITSVENFGNKSIVKTQNTLDYGFGKFVSDYEFHLSYENERWYLEQIFYVTDEGRYECL